WNPVYLLLLAVSWHLMSLVWKAFKNYTDAYMTDFIIDAKLAYKLSYKYDEMTKRYKDEVLKALKFLRTSGIGTQVVFGYLVSMWITFLVHLAQFFIVTNFAAEESYLWGFYAVSNSWKSGTWVQLKSFPYISFCNMDRAV
uniref:Innexin n=1 Tax=Acrobeloides nanus TaxID=290746 RepID=A0A914D8B1_9BILA